MSRITPLLLIAAASLAHPGSAVAASVGADFDGDGYADLAVGAPLDSVSGQSNAGAVNIIYGSGSGGLSTRGDQQFTQDTRGVKAFASGDDLFGSALAAGELNGDGYDDLAIGVPGEDVSGKRDAGAVHVLYGSDGGLSTVDDDLFYQARRSVKGSGEAFDRFGAALAIGHFRGWRAASLAIGAPGDGVGGHTNAGTVNVLRGARDGVRTRGDQLWTRNTSGVPGAAAPYDFFGTALAAGDLSRNGRAELAIGAPGRDALEVESPLTTAGSVLVLYGSGRGRGLTTRAAQDWSQGSSGIKGAPGLGDGFGSALAIADFDDDGAGDLAVGAPYDMVGGRAGAGAVNVIYGSDTGLREDPDELWTQRTGGIRGAPEEADLFGAALVGADFSRNGAADLAVAVPREDFSGRTDPGMAQVLYGRRQGGLSSADAAWHQGSSGVKGRLESGDQLGTALAAGDFDDDGDADLAASVPFEGYSGIIAAGGVNVLYGSKGGVSSADDLFLQGTRGIKGAPGQDLLGAALASGG